MRRESGPLTSMGTFIRTQFNLKGLLNELKLHPFSNPTEYQKGASYIPASPPLIWHWLAHCHYWILLICVLLSPTFAYQKTKEVFKFLWRNVWLIRAWLLTLRLSCFYCGCKLFQCRAGWGLEIPPGKTGKWTHGWVCEFRSFCLSALAGAALKPRTWAFPTWPVTNWNPNKEKASALNPPGHLPCAN